MYLKGSKWSMQRRRKRINPFRILILLALVAGGLYINQVVVPATPPLFIPTPTPTRSPDSYISDAQAAIASGKINQAIETYKEAVKADPRNPAVYITLARWQVLYGDLAGALENVENALLLNANNAQAYAVRGWVLGKQGDYLAGEAELKKALDLDPNSALAYAYLAEIYKDKIDVGKEDFNTRDLAVDASRRALDLDSSLFEVHRARGLVLEVTGNYDEAIIEFEAAVGMVQNIADLHLALGRNYNAVGAYDKAVDQFNIAISYKPDAAEPYAALARTYLTVGEFAKGIQLAEQAVEKDPADPFNQSLLGTLLYRNGDYKASVKPLRLATKGGFTDDGRPVEGIPLDTNITSINLYSRYGLALANSGECGEALVVSQAIVDTIPDDENAVYNAELMVETCRELAENPVQETEEPAVEETPQQ